MQLMPHTPKLEHVNLFKNSSITDNAIVMIAMTCPDLRHLDVSFCSSFTDDSQLALALQCHSLEYLNITQCMEVTDTGISTLATSCHKQVAARHIGIFCDLVTTLQPLRSSTQMKHLDVTGCHRIREITADTWTELKYVNLSRCQVTNTSIISIAHNCSKLQHLHLTQCQSVSDPSIIQIATSCLKLQTLMMATCQGVTDSSITVIAKKSIHLTQIGIQGCFNISSGALQRLKLARPHAIVIS